MALRILGVDPGTRFLGYGVVESRDRHVASLGHGVVRADAGAPLAMRLKQLFDELQRVVHIFRPTAVAVEGVFSHKNARSALVLGHARGVALLVAAIGDLPVFEYAPARIKKAVGAGGNDSKDSVARMVAVQLRLTEKVDRFDVTDALAVALCHLHSSRMVAAPSVQRPSSRREGASATRRVDDFRLRLKPSVVRAQ